MAILWQFHGVDQPERELTAVSILRLGIAPGLIQRLPGSLGSNKKIVQAYITTCNEFHPVGTEFRSRGDSTAMTKSRMVLRLKLAFEQTPWL